MVLGHDIDSVVLRFETASPDAGFPAGELAIVLDGWMHELAAVTARLLPYIK